MRNTIITATAALAYIAAISVGNASMNTSVPQPIPTVERPAPDRIIVHNADYATLTPWDEVYAIQSGIEFGYSHVWEEGTIEYWVNPVIEYEITMYSPDDPDTAEIDRAITTATIPVSLENRLDWILYNRIRWERDFNDLVTAEDIGFFEISASMQRIHGRLEEEDN